MILVRNNQERGNTHNSWLNSYHTFSFSNYYDPEFMGFGNLQVINEDTVQPNSGFDTHAHKNMEIISYVIKGELEHKDSLNNGSLIKPGEIQRMSAGTGIRHSEFNPSSKKDLHFLQIWVVPHTIDLKPSYEQKTIHKVANQFILIGSEDSQEEGILIHQNIKLYVAYLKPQKTISHFLHMSHLAWIQVIRGKILANEVNLSAGDGAGIFYESRVTVNCLEEAEFLLFDLG